LFGVKASAGSDEVSGGKHDCDGGTGCDNTRHTEPVISPQAAFQMVSMLQDVIDLPEAV
jgi:hypothetical protein